MRRRGHVMLLTAVVLTSAVAGGAVFASRHLALVQQHRPDAARTQLLWLARTACDAAPPRTVKTAQGEVTLTRTGRQVTASLHTATASVDCATGQERFTR